MAYQLQEINHRAKTDPKGFMEACDAAYTARITDAASRIAERQSTSPIVLLSGPSGSGKTTTALKLEEALRQRGINSYTVSMDNYFFAMDPKLSPRTPEGDIDYESPKRLDEALLHETFAQLSRGEEVVIPCFEFLRQMRNDARGVSLKLKKNEIVIFEGIHALNDDIAGRHSEATKLYISARSNVQEGHELRFKGTWMRLTRRAVRDYNFRGTDVAATLAMWANVRRGEKLYISPFKNKADIVIDSSQLYEVPVMKSYAQPILQAVPTENQRRDELLDLIAAFERFEPIDPALVAKNSILREFIGGGSYQQ